MSDPSDFVCCPCCHDPVTVVRVGMVGRYAHRVKVSNRSCSPWRIKPRPDSPTFRCTACRMTFRVKGGMTWAESMGSVK